MNTSSFSVVREINNAEDAGSTTNKHQRELLFQKALTPSDVGKLNRLVIPKQYAEKYFPLRSVSGRSNNSGSTESLLSFEDEMGKIWRFRYSYWTSSQSYVLTKGWSGYVKEKGLTAGDIVSFHRKQCNNSDQITNRLFIAWQTRLQSTGTTERIKYRSTGDYWSTPTAFFPAPQPYRPLHPATNLSHKYIGGENLQMVSISNTPRRLRLFGVNMEFIESDQSSDVASGALKI